MQMVYQDWAESMQDFSLGAIRYAIEKSGNMPHPPNKGEFIETCREYAPKQNNVFRIGHQLTPEQQQKNRERLNGLVQKYVTGREIKL